MSDKDVSSGKQYVYSFSSGKLVLLVSTVLILMALSMMLGIRVERLQGGADSNGFETVKTPITLSAASSPEVKLSANGQPQMQEIRQPPQPVESAPSAAAPPAASDPEITQKTAPTSRAATELPQKTALIQQQEKEPAKVAEVKKVVVSPPPVPEKQLVQQSAPVVKGRYAIQVSSSQDKAMAEHQVEEFQKKGLHAFIEQINIENKGRFYRVLLGPYTTETDATATLEKLKKDASFAGSYVRYLP